MQTNKFSEPQHMSKSALLVMFIKYIKRDAIALFIIIPLLFMDNEGMSLVQKIVYPILCLLGLLLIYFLITFIRYYCFKFYVADGSLIVKQGVFSKKTLHIPTNKIFSLRTKSGFFYRLFDMKGISVDTLAEKDKEVELIIDDADWHDLLEMVKDDNTVSNVVDSDGDVDNKNVEQNDVSTLRYSNMALLKGAFCQNHLRGTIIMAVVLFNILAQVDLSVLETAAMYAEDHSEMISFTITTVVVALVGLYIVSLVLWLGKILLRYYNLQLNVSTEKLFFEGGLITRRSVRFAYDKVCTLAVKINPLERLLKCSTVTLKQAFNVAGEDGDNNVKVYGCTITDKFLTWWLGNDYKTSELITSTHSGTGVFWYAIRFKLIFIIVASAALLYFDYPEYIYLLALLLLIYIIQGCMHVRRSSIVLKDDYFIINAGSFSTVTNYLKYSNIEHIAIRCTLFTPLTHRVHLFFHTNGTTFVVRSLKHQEALHVYELILAKLYKG